MGDIAHGQPRLTLEQVAKELARRNAGRFLLKLEFEVARTETEFVDGFARNWADRQTERFLFKHNRRLKYEFQRILAFPELPVAGSRPATGGLC
jgi:hypothetical protein